MKLGLFAASLFTLGILSGFVVAILLGIAYYFGGISWQVMIGAIILFNFLVWLIGPYITTLIQRWLYKVEFYEYEQIKNEPYAKFVKSVCDKYDMPFPKIGIIPDDNPTAFTYGSAAFNARIVVTRGLFKFLNGREVNAVMAHEIGHIKNKDFITMTIAATLLQILYGIYVMFTRSRGGAAMPAGKSGEKKGGAAAAYVIGWISYVFWVIGTYVVLFLSRIREYAADEFAARETGDPNALSSALIKIAYGIASVPDTEKTAHLLNQTRAQGIFDVKAAKEFGILARNGKGQKEFMENALLYDLVNPWAAFLELSSTHPLTGKRIRRLSDFSSKPLFSFDSLAKKTYDRGRMWRNFITDFFVQYSTTAFVLVFLVWLGLSWENAMANPLYFAGVFFGGLVLLGLLKAWYRYPMGAFEKTTVLECMGDLYASPVRGKRIELGGRAIGKGQAGYVFGEDMIFEDKSGIIYLNYENIIPIFGNMVFGWKKVEKLVGKPAKVRGWFVRGATHHVELDLFATAQERIQSRVRFWAFFGPIALSLIVFAIGFYIWL